MSKLVDSDFCFNHEPTRAAERAKAFVQELPPTYNLGLVSFAKSANVLVPPSKDRLAVQQAIDGLTLAEATATGEAVFTCLDAVRSVPADGAQGIPPARIVLLSDGYRTSVRSVEEACDELRRRHDRGKDESSLRHAPHHLQLDHRATSLPLTSSF